MIKVKYLGKTPEYLESFPDCCKRSNIGSIHLIPNNTKSLTSDEFEHIKKCRVDILGNLRVISVSAEPKKVEVKPKEVVKSIIKEDLISKSIPKKKDSKRK